MKRARRVHWFSPSSRKARRLVQSVYDGHEPTRPLCVTPGGILVVAPTVLIPKWLEMTEEKRLEFITFVDATSAPDVRRILIGAIPK